MTDADFQADQPAQSLWFPVRLELRTHASVGYLYTILPQLRKMYGDRTPELKKMMKLHAPIFQHVKLFQYDRYRDRLGVGRRRRGPNQLETVNGLKAGLMGPFAAIGDASLVL